MKECNEITLSILDELGYDGTSRRIDDIAYWLLDEFWVLMAVEPFIYNGTIYNFIPKIYSPFLFENGTEHMNGYEVLGDDGHYFLEFEDAYEAGVNKAINIIKENLEKFRTL